MKKIVSLLSVILFCGSVFSQIYTPIVPTAYGEKQNRLKALYALHVPEKDTATLTADTSAQILYRPLDSTFWGYSKARGYWKIGSITDASTGLAPVLAAKWSKGGDLGLNPSTHWLGANDSISGIPFKINGHHIAWIGNHSNLTAPIGPFFFTQGNLQAIGIHAAKNLISRVISNDSWTNVGGAGYGGGNTIIGTAAGMSIGTEADTAHTNKSIMPTEMVIIGWQAGHSIQFPRSSSSGRSVIIGANAVRSAIAPSNVVGIGFSNMEYLSLGFNMTSVGGSGFRSAVDNRSGVGIGVAHAQFASTGINTVTVNTGGSDYHQDSITVTPSSPLVGEAGSQCYSPAILEAVVSGGAVTAIIVKFPGCGYSTRRARRYFIASNPALGLHPLPTVTITSTRANGLGTGATATPNVSSADYMTAIGENSMRFYYMGQENTGVGYLSGIDLLRHADTGTTMIGARSGADVGNSTTNLKTYLYSTALGYNTRFNKSYQTVLGTPLGQEMKFYADSLYFPTLNRVASSTHYLSFDSATGLGFYAPVTALGGGGGTPGGLNTELQYNNAGAFGGITGATSDGTNLFVPTLYGSSAANGDLTLRTTTNATKTTSHVFLADDGGEVLIGGSTDNGTFPFQVNGLSYLTDNLRILGGKYLEFKGSNDPATIQGGDYFAGKQLTYDATIHQFSVPGAGVPVSISSTGLLATSATVSSLSNTHIAYSSSGALTGSANLVWDNGNSALELGGINITSAGVDLGVSGSAHFSNAKFEIGDWAAIGETYAAPSIGGINGYGLYIQPAISSGGAGAALQMGYYNGSNWYSALEYANVASGFATIQLMKGGGYVEIGGRLKEKQGADVASANNLTLGTDGNTFEITGTTQINLINATGWSNGNEITLIFSSNVTVKNGQTTSGSNITIMLDSGADFAATADDLLKLKLCEVGGVQAWRQVSRSVN